eukprot:TRINITY_DN11650_c0_g1_i1.p1 TRINITY_DN11650_c0_g1~~TRINITY_DN11650_c0_g1_i1.p1  ORF type:complete len:74 (+),score=7.50 TRINITY_DN11650_c0_g1_i1:43-264(+)
MWCDMYSAYVDGNLQGFWFYIKISGLLQIIPPYTCFQSQFVFVDVLKFFVQALKIEKFPPQIFVVIPCCVLKF